MTRRVTSKLAVAGTSVLPQMSGVFSSRTGLAVEPLGSCHIRNPRAFLQKVVDSFAFEVVSFSLILANAVIVSVRIDRSAMCARSSCPSGHDHTLAWSDEVFLALFLVELMLRIMATRQSYFTGDMWQWNVLDFLLAAWSVHEVSQDRCSFMYVRILRFFRLVRLLRVTNSVLWLRDLRLMACTLLQSLVSIFWAFVLLFVVMYCFGVCFTNAVSGYYLAGNKYTGSSEHDRRLHEDLNHILDKLYGSLPRTMCTLLLAITNGADWMTLAEPLGEVHVVYVAMFAAYVVLVLVGALNVLTSLFVERARELSRSDRDLATQAELASQEAFIVEMRRIFEEVDEDKDGMITWEKFRDYLKNERAQAFFTTQALDTSDAAGLFNLLDKEGKGKIKVEDFALGCMRLRGQAKSSEVATLMRESRKASRKLMTEIRGLKDQLELTQPSEAEHPASHRGAARWMASRTLSVAGRPRAAAVGAQHDCSPMSRQWS
jgi:hypothetical protein